MSLIVPPSSIFAGQSNTWWRRSAALKMSCAAFVAGAVLAGLALKVPAGSSRGADATAGKPVAAEKLTASTEKRDGAASSAAPCEQQTWPYLNDDCRNVKPAPKAQAVPSGTAEPVRVIAPAKEPVVTATAATPPETPRPQTSREADPNVGAAPRSTAQAEVPENPILAQKAPLPKPRPAQMAAQQALDSERAAQAVADRENALAAGDSPAPHSPTIASPRERIIAPKENEAQESSHRAPPRETKAATAPEAQEPSRRAPAREIKTAAAPTEIKAAAAPARDVKRTQRAERSSPAARSHIRQARSDEESTERTAHSRSLQAQNEAEGFSLVRSHRLPDGRRVTVYRRVLDEEPSRAMAYGDPYRSRRMSLSPFSSNGFPFSFW